jgi:hypothetical protein
VLQPAAARFGVDSAGARRSGHGTFTGGRQLNAWSVRPRPSSSPPLRFGISLPMRAPLREFRSQPFVAPSSDLPLRSRPAARLRFPSLRPHAVVSGWESASCFSKSSGTNAALRNTAFLGIPFARALPGPRRVTPRWPSPAEPCPPRPLPGVPSTPLEAQRSACVRASRDQAGRVRKVPGRARGHHRGGRLGAGPRA